MEKVSGGTDKAAIERAEGELAAKRVLVPALRPAPMQPMRPSRTLAY